MIAARTCPTTRLHRLKTRRTRRHVGCSEPAGRQLANRLVGHKLASGFLRSRPATRARFRRSQVVELHQVNRLHGYAFAPGCTVAANSAHFDASSPTLFSGAAEAIYESQTLEKLEKALELIKKHRPGLYRKLMEKLASGKLNLGTTAFLDAEYRNTATGATQTRVVGGGVVHGLSPELLVMTVNSVTTPEQIAAVLVHEIVHIRQNPAKISSVERELRAYKEQYKFMKDLGMDTSVFDKYLDNGKWSDAKFRTEYTAKFVTAPGGGTWEQTGQMGVYLNLPDPPPNPAPAPPSTSGGTP
jgi:hypothetical protein